MQKTSFQQIIKFVATGVANTAIDLVLLNVLLLIFGVSPLKYAIFKTFAFLFALANSYILNKYWVFDKKATNNSLLKERLSFVVLSVISLLLNSLVSSWAFFVLTQHTFAVSPLIAANAGAVAGILVVFLINFMSYKFIVFA